MRCKDKNWCLRHNIEIKSGNMESDSTGAVLYQIYYLGTKIGDYWAYSDKLYVLKRRWIKRLINERVMNDKMRMNIR